LYLNVDILVLPIPTAIRAAKEATQTIPIVIVASLDPVATGLIDNLARPGGNITGISTLSQDLNGKRLELLKEVVPQLTRAGILVDFEPPGTAINLKDMKARHGLLKYRLKLLRCVV
jgi:putative ABC transport system substrate-binding protein